MFCLYQRRLAAVKCLEFPAGPLKGEDVVVNSCLAHLYHSNLTVGFPLPFNQFQPYDAICQEILHPVLAVPALVQRHLGNEEGGDVKVAEELIVIEKLGSGIVELGYDVKGAERVKSKKVKLAVLLHLPDNVLEHINPVPCRAYPGVSTLDFLHDDCNVCQHQCAFPLCHAELLLYV